jgi:hypothetical protein
LRFGGLSIGGSVRLPVSGVVSIEAEFIAARHAEDRAFETVMPPTRPNAGAIRTDRSDAPSIGVHAVAGVDVPVSNSAMVFGALRVDFRNAFGVSLGFHYLAGTRIRF